MIDVACHMFSMIIERFGQQQELLGFCGELDESRHQQVIGVSVPRALANFRHLRSATRLVA